MKPPWLRLLARIGVIRREELRIRLEGVRTPTSGILSVRAFVELLVETSIGTRQPVRFLVDSGASTSRISAVQAAQLQFPLSLASVPFGITERTASGSQRVTIRRGLIRTWLQEDQRSVPFVFPISYVDNIPSTVVPLLGLGDVVSQLRWVFDGRPFTNSPYGFCQFIDCRPLRNCYPDS